MRLCVIWLLATVFSAWGAEPAFKIAIYEQEFLCVRVNQLPENFAEQLRRSQPTNRIAGLVVDLRFATVTAATNLSLPAKLGKMPVAVLVNAQTSPLAWEWAAAWRRAGGGILIGSAPPAGNHQPDILVATPRDEELKFQQNPFTDISVNAVQGFSNTNALLPFIDHTSEAELVRQRVKDGEEDNTGTPRPEAPKVIRDPALARAIDWLKALAVLKPVRG